MRAKLLVPVFPVLCAIALGQGLNPSTLLNPPPNAWPTYNGDYSGRRYSELKQITTANVHNLSLAWAARFTSANAGPTAYRSSRRRCW